MKAPCHNKVTGVLALGSTQCLYPHCLTSARVMTPSLHAFAAFSIAIRSSASHGIGRAFPRNELSSRSNAGSIDLADPGSLRITRTVGPFRTGFAAGVAVTVLILLSLITNLWGVVLLLLVTRPTPDMNSTSLFVFGNSCLT